MTSPISNCARCSSALAAAKRDCFCANGEGCGCSKTGRHLQLHDRSGSSVAHVCKLLTEPDDSGGETMGEGRRWGRGEIIAWTTCCECRESASGCIWGESYWFKDQVCARYLGFRINVRGLGFRINVRGLGFRFNVRGLGFRFNVRGLGFRTCAGSGRAHCSSCAWR
jgi:hypothetical protein